GVVDLDRGIDDGGGGRGRFGSAQAACCSSGAARGHCSSMNRTVLIVGSAITIALVAVLFLGLGKDPTAINSPLVGKPAPPFALTSLDGQRFDISQLRGKPDRKSTRLNSSHQI